MIKVRRLGPDGVTAFKAWLENPDGKEPPAHLLGGLEHTEPAGDATVDPNVKFATRFEFGVYLNERFKALDFMELMSQQNDGLWAWLAVLYFRQLAPGKPQKYWHYLVTRAGPAGSLAYRQAVRTSYELVHVHAAKAQVCLAVPMSTWGEMAEQLASRQTLSHNRGFFETACDLYVSGGSLRRGASSKPKKPRDRKAGDRAGFGGARRLAIALQRLDLTFDTEIMGSPSLIAVLPKEFSKWKEAA